MKKNITNKDKENFYEKNFPKEIFGTAERYETFLKKIQELRPSRFLDFGCGDGSFAYIVKNKLNVKKVCGVDISKKGILRARKRGINGFCLDIDKKNLPFKNDFFDVIFCGEVIEHVYSPDHLLEELYRVLRPKGILLLTTPNLAAWFNRLSLLLGFQPMFTDISLKYSFGHIWKVDPVGHLRLYTLDALKRLMESYYFKILDIQGIGINDRVGYGKTFSLITKIANFIFKKPSLNASIFITASKDY